jgi:mRNA interferase YafQ
LSRPHDYKREKKGPHGKRLDTLLSEVLDMLSADKPLPARFHDHTLLGRMGRLP